MKRLVYWALFFIAFKSFSAETTTPNVLIFAVQPSYAKMFDNNGLEDNIVIKLSKALNVEVKVYVCPWARCVRSIENGLADIIDDLFYSKDREKYTYYLQPNFATQTAGFRFFADNLSVPVIKQWDDLSNLRIGMLRGYKHFPKFDTDKKLSKIDFLDINTAVNMLLKERIDVIIVPPSFDEKSLQKIDTGKILSQQPYAHIEDISLYLGLSKKSPWFAHRKTIEAQLMQLVKPEIELKE
jgi:polar amino acid transport system substrate-binding protein